ncbi:MAG: Ig-like domain-containing protein [Candidatus Fimenecus sp.]
MKINIKSKKTVFILIAVVAVLVGIITAILVTYQHSHTPQTVEIVCDADNAYLSENGNNKILVLRIGNTLQLSTIIEPADCKAKVVWAVEGDNKAETGEGKVISLDNTGLITAENAGKVIVKATAGEGKKAKSATITVMVTKSDAELMQELKDEIAALPDTENLTAEDKEKVEELKAKYDSLSAEYKDRLTDEKDKLSNAVSKVEESVQEPTGVTSEESTTAETTSAPIVTPPTTTKPSDNTSTTKPSGGSSGTTKPTEPTTSKPKPTEPTTSKPTEPTTSKPKDFAMSPEEAMAYARSVCEARGLKWQELYTKDNVGWNVPATIGIEDTEEQIKENIRGSIDCTYHKYATEYKIIIESCKDAVGNDAYKMYFLYAD